MNHPSFPCLACRPSSSDRRRPTPRDVAADPDAEARASVAVGAAEAAGAPARGRRPHTSGRQWPLEQRRVEPYVLIFGRDQLIQIRDGFKIVHRRGLRRGFQRLRSLSENEPTQNRRTRQRTKRHSPFDPSSPATPRVTSLIRQVFRPDLTNDIAGKKRRNSGLPGFTQQFPHCVVLVFLRLLHP